MTYPNTWKPFFDFIVSLLMLIMLSWLMILICLGFLVSFSFPIVFRQERITKGNIPFLLLKFRTLKVSNENIAERRFLWGDFLRATSLDELPQLWNVLKGEMSLIGPRPLPVEYLPLMNEEQKQRHQVKPGITGLAQVNGRNSISWEEKFKLDTYYVHHVSLLLDLKIVFKTILLLLSFKKDVSLNEERFTGEEKA